MDARESINDGLNILSLHLLLPSIMCAIIHEFPRIFCHLYCKTTALYCYVKAVKQLTK